jgi:hypothetical protein
MNAKLSFACILMLSNTLSISAQRVSQMPYHSMEQSNVTNLIGSLTQNALLVLLGAIVLVGIIWVCFIFKACTQLDKPKVNNRKYIFNAIMFLIGLSIFGTVAQQTRAADYRAAQAAEKIDCRRPHQHESHTANSFNNGAYNGTKSYQNWHAPTFCKHCGKRIFISSY